MRHSATSLLFALVLAVSIATSVFAGPFQDGLAAYSRGVYATALQLWRPLAAQGHENAIENRDIVASRMTPADISEAQRLAREWKPK